MNSFRLAPRLRWPAVVRFDRPRPSRWHHPRSIAARWLLVGGWLGLAWPALALDLNSATEAELDGLSGAGPAFTARVMQARAERPFQDWADFMRRVKGVREPTALRLTRQGVRIQHAPYISPPARVARD